MRNIVLFGIIYEITEKTLMNLLYYLNYTTMRKLLLLFGIALMLSFAACEKRSDISNQELALNNKLEMNTNAADLAARIEIVNRPVVFEGKSANALSYTWVANILPYTVDGSVLSASTVDGYGDMAYVGWHAYGDSVAGAMTVISVANPLVPVTVSEQTFLQQEFNDIEVRADKNRIFFAGEATNEFITGDPVGDENAFAWSLILEPNGTFNVFNWEKTFLGYSANSVTYTTYGSTGAAWVSMGSVGGITVIDDNAPSMVPFLADQLITNAKHFDATGTWGVLLYGDGLNKSKVRIWDLLNSGAGYFAWDKEYEIPYDVTPLGKNSIDVNANNVYLAMGDDGIVRVNLVNGIVQNIFNNGGSGFANGVNVGPNYIYAAYGADGLYVLDKVTLDVVGHWDYNGSCNYVKVVGDFLYLANGNADGMIILHKD